MTLCKGTTSVLNPFVKVMSHSEEARNPLIYGLLETMKFIKFTQKTYKFMSPTTMNLAQKVRAAYSGKQQKEPSLFSTSLSSKITPLVIHLKLTFPGMIVDLKHQTSIATNLKEKIGAVKLAVPMLMILMKSSASQRKDLAGKTNPEDMNEKLSLDVWSARCLNNKK